MKKIYLFLILSCLIGSAAIAQTTTFSYTGAVQSYTVPTGLTSIGIDIAGGCGGNSLSNSYGYGGAGGRVQCNLAVSGGEVLYLYVGGHGINAGSGSTGGWNGGGNASCYGDGGGGGGASDIRLSNSAVTTYSATSGTSGYRVIVAGGGGGAGYAESICTGGAGGGTTGGVGWMEGSQSTYLCYEGAGGTQSAGGQDGTCYSYYAVIGQGGECTGVASFPYEYYTGAGGGGYYGGGSGYYYGGGGGGSSFTAPGSGVNTCSNVTHTQGYNGGVAPASPPNGYITIIGPTITASPTSLSFGYITTSTSSAIQTTTITGINLTGATVTLSPPTNYSISLDGSTWSSSAITLPYTGSSFSTPLYVQFNAPASAGTYSGNIGISGGGISATYNVAVTGNAAAACSGTPTAGTASCSPSSGNAGTAFTLSIGTTTSGGISYQWQSSPNSTTWSNIYGATNNTFSWTGISSTTYFRCVVGCSATTTNSNTVTVTNSGVPSSSCTPTCVESCCICSYPFSVAAGSSNPFTTTGASGTSITDNGACSSGYVDQSASLSVTYNAGTVYTVTVAHTETTFGMTDQIWIDFNSDGVFQTSESVGGSNYTGSASVEHPEPITIPSSALSGTFRMRVINAYASDPLSYPSIPPCPSTSGASEMYYCEARDYKVTIVGASGGGAVASVTATPSVAFGPVTVSTTSLPPQYFVISGSNLSVSPLTLTPPANFSISLDGNTWYTSTSPMTLGYSAGYPTGSLTPTNVYVRFSPGASPSSYSGNIAITGGSLSATVNEPVTGSGVAACSGTPTAGTAAITPTSGGIASLFTLSLSGTSSAGGLTYQWQSSSSSTGTFTNIAGANQNPYSFVGISATTYYQCVVTCSGSGASATSSVVSVGAVTGSPAGSSCTPAFDYACSSYPMNTSLASLVGASGAITDPSNTGTGSTSCATNYVDNTSTMSVTLSSGSSYTATFNCGGPPDNEYSNFAIEVWIDFNNNGAFESSEVIGGFPQGSPSNAPTAVLTIPSGLSSGVHRMRVLGEYYPAGYGYPNYPSMSACPTTAINYGNARDYTAIIAPGAPPCTTTPSAGIVTTAASSSCLAFTPALYNTGELVNATGISYNWQISSTGTFGSFSNITGATGEGYNPAISTPGTYYFRQTATCANGGSTANTGNLSITLYATPGITASATSVCTGSTVTLSGTPTGGTWSSGSSAATVNSTSGVVTGVTGGTVATISYTTTSGCIGTQAITINTLPANITGTTSVCASLTTALTDSTTGGTWSSGSSLVSVVGSTGVVTGVGAGTPTITYTAFGGCYKTAAVTVLPFAAITGVPSVCLGYTTTLADAATGGTWSSGTTAAATVSTTGVVTAVSAGSTIITYAVASTGCSTSVLVSVTPPPSVYTTVLAGSGSYCAGGSGTSIGLTGSNTGIIYQLYNGTTAVGATVTGAGFPFTFPFLVTGAGSYGVIADPGTACATFMSGSPVVTVNPLPTQYTVIAPSTGAAYCSGGSGVHILLSSSTVGVSYQLYSGGTTPVGGALPGTSASLDFGAQTGTGPYTVVATNTTTTCVQTMLGSVTVTINPLPTNSFTITGGGGFCSGGSGVPLGLSGSQSPGFTYQLYNGSTAVGSVVSGTGSAFSFGSTFTSPGTYNVLATNTATGCTSNMVTATSVVVNSLPTIYTVTGGGAYCAGGTGVSIGLSSSATGTSYQLYLGTTAVGSVVSGTGAAISFGLYTAAGSYTVTATNTSGCVNNMFGSAIVSINALPTAFSVTQTAASYCAGGTGVGVGLSGSSTGVNYNLYLGTTLVGGSSGTSGAISFGLELLSGTYTVVATNATTGCVNNMSGVATIVVNPLPNIETMTSGTPTSYCAGGTGVHVGLTPSQSGVTYQLFNAGVPSAATPTSGTGTAVDFGAQTAGTYTSVATNATTGCSSNMSGSIAITANPLPTIYAVTGGGNYCSGGTGVHIGLLGSNLGISYQVMLGTAIMGSAVAGTGGSLDFGAFTATGTYTVVASNPTTGCTSTMSGGAIVGTSPLPAVYSVTVSGGGNYCAGSLGDTIGLSSSATGVNYQLFRGSSAVGSLVAGSTGSSINFGPWTAGTYTVVGITGTTACTSNMTGSALITANPLPTIYNVTGGGNFCTGGTGVHIGLSASASGFSYQVMNGSALSGAPVLGTGAVLDFGLKTGTGTYTVVATNSITGCTNTMFGTATVGTTALPAAFAVTGGGNYCFGTPGVPIGLFSSVVGVNYQLYIGGASVGSPVTGTGGSLSFGSVTATGTYNVLATNPATGCSAIMTGSPVVNISALPAAHSVTGGGSYCPGGAGSTIGLDGSNSGTLYQLYLGTSALGTPVAGTGTPISFGLKTGTGTYTVVANTPATTCSNNMTGSVAISISPLPTLYTVTGGGNYCPGTSGSDVGLSGSSSGTTYQLMNGSTTVGGPISGSGLPIDFGLQPVTGTYTVVATGTSSTCTNNMTGSVTVGLGVLPATHDVTGGGNYCAGGTGIDIGLNGSDAGNNYQLMNGITAIGAVMAGTGSAIDFGSQTAAGIYTIVATSSASTCSGPMTGSATVAISALPTAYGVTGGGNYCSGSAGVHILLTGSDAGVIYQLFNGTTPVGLTVAGTGTSTLDMGLETAAGTYTVMGSSPATTCSNNMAGSATVNIIAAPPAYTVTGGGNFCTGGAGVHVGLSASNTGVTYQLLIGGAPIGSSMLGTGSSIDFGLQTVSGTYSVAGTSLTSGCVGDMSGSVFVNATTLPPLHTVVAMGSNYCAGGSGIDVSLSGSDVGISYELYHGTSLVSTIAGTGAAIDFGSQTAPGTYTVVANGGSVSCTRNMSGAAVITITPLPSVFSLTGGGSYCDGGAGIGVGLSGSDVGVSYQLYNGTTSTGSSVIGTGSSISFGMQTLTGGYSIVATNLSTGCANNMSGSVAVSTNSLPNLYPVSGGGNYCAGGSGATVTVTGSDAGVSYQLYKGIGMVGTPVTGTGAAISFAPATAAGVYTVMATNTTTTCSSTMLGSATIAINPLPTAFSVTGGGNYCAGAGGVHVGISSSASGISYQLFDGAAAAGSAVSGSGSGIDFGLKTAAGVYTIVATDGSTMCTNNMSGSATVAINPLPTAYSVVGGGSYCAEGAGVHVGLNNSGTGVNYQAYNSSGASGGAVAGSGGPLDLGLKMVAGTYTVVALNGLTGCSSNMAGSATVSVTPLVTPGVTVASSGGDTLCAGNFNLFTATVTHGGTAPTYQWTVNGIVSGTGSTYTYIPTDGDNVMVTVTSTAPCATPATVSSSTLLLAVNPTETPAVSVFTSPGTEVCQGQSVNFTATPAYGGTAPTYAWINNVSGSTLGTGPTFSYVPANGDIIHVMMTSNYHCRLSGTANSGNEDMIVDIPATPTVTITSNPGLNIVTGESVSFNAGVSGGGTAPTYQWLVNGIPVPGATGPTFTASDLQNLDTVTCQVLSGGACSGIMGQQSVVIHVRSNVGVQQITSATGDIQLVPNPNKGIFTVKGTMATTTDEEVSLEVTDLLGQVIYTGKVQVYNGVINEKIQLGNTIANGMYILNLRSDSDNKVFHMVIEQ